MSLYLAVHDNENGENCDLFVVAGTDEKAIGYWRDYAVSQGWLDPEEAAWPTRLFRLGDIPTEEGVLEWDGPHIRPVQVL